MCYTKEICKACKAVMCDTSLSPLLLCPPFYPKQYRLDFVVVSFWVGFVFFFSFLWIGWMFWVLVCCSEFFEWPDENFLFIVKHNIASNMRHLVLAHFSGKDTVVDCPLAREFSLFLLCLVILNFEYIPCVILELIENTNTYFPP